MDFIWTLRILVALVGTGIAAWYDLYNKKNVPENFLYAFLGIALILNVLDYSLFISRLPLAALLIVILYMMYKVGQLGGADLMVLAAIYCAIPTMTSPLIPTTSSFISEILSLPSLFTILAISVILCALWLVIKYGPRLIRDTLKGKIKFKTINLLIAIAMILVYGFLLIMIIQLSSILSISILHIVFLTLVVILVFFFSIYKDALMEHMIVWKKKVEQEEIIMLEALPAALIEKMHLGRLVTEQQMKKMNKIKRMWPVLDLPAFVPCILIGLALYILFGDSILFFA